uniref:Polyketide synthase n=1 Tax=Russula virescens TaxID=71688 RepID=A0A8B0JNP9_9AGAM|nr:polyketide synthase [Russula virescens]
MEHLNIPIFSGQGTVSVDSPRVQEQAINSSSSPTGTLLLSSCFEAFHSELSSLSDTELEMTEKYFRNPVVSGTRLLLIQVLIYFKWATSIVGDSQDAFASLLERNRQNGTGIIGFSSGIISACITGTSATLLDFLFNATSAFRVALWIGVRTQIYRSRALLASGLHVNDSRSWSSILLGMGRRAAEEAVSRFCLQGGELDLVYVSAVNDDQCITVSGHPDILSSFIATLPETVTVLETSIGTLYHSPAHNGRVCEEVLADLWRRKIRFPTYDDIICPIRSTFTGEVLEANKDRSLVRDIVDMILLHQVNWDKVINSVAKSIPENQTAHLVNVGPGSSLMRSMEKALRNGALQVMTHYLSYRDTKVSTPEPARDYIAIIGMAVNMPGAPNASKLWEILEEGINTVMEVPENRFRVDSYAMGPVGRSMNVHTGNFLDDVDKFDHKFFNISPREARSMDPQMRILLHMAYEALEDSGYVPNASQSFNPDTFGCYVGVATGDYALNLRNNIDVYYSTGNLRAFLSGRISYAMGFGGPSMVVDTACSSSLVAIYQACRALLSGDCNAALAGGVNVITSPDMFIGLDRGHFLSPTGQCKVFDASADGYSRGEGCGLFVLKRLSDARVENDRILGIIRGIEVNQSAEARSITQPHIPTQIKLFRQLLETSGVAPETVNVVEAHGTGTQTGDIGELESIRRVFAADRLAGNPLHITSIKANIGHLEAASGAAGLAKLLLMLQHHIIPRLISLVDLNPGISQLAADHTIIDTESQPWDPSSEGLPRMALLNNFGASGSNCALLLQEYIHPAILEKPAPSTFPYIFGISAKTEIALARMRMRMVDWLNDANTQHASLSNISYSLTARRQIYEHRVSLTARTKDELIESLLSGPASTRVSRANGRAVFVFSGQGGQYVGMGSELYRSVPLFRRIIEQCHGFLETSGFAGVVQFIAPGENLSNSSEIDQLEICHCAIFALEYALAQLWIYWGVTPAIVVGHSLGEYVAQTVAGVLTLQDALLLVANRARLMAQKCTSSSTGMMAVNLCAATIGRILTSSEEFSAITIACYNSPDDHVISGPVANLRALRTYLDTNVGCKCLLLPVGFGHHTSALRPIRDDLTFIARRVRISPPVIPIISNAYGKLVLPGDASVFDAQYYSRHCTEPVLFDDGIRALVATDSLSAIDAWIEMGPQAIVLPTLRRHPLIQKNSMFLASMRKQQHPLASLHSSLAQLYVSPFDIKWRNVFSHLPSVSNTSLPTYPWSTASFWVAFEEEAPPTFNTARLPGPKIERPGLPYTVLHMWIQFPSSGNGFSSVFETPLSHLSKLICGHRVGNQPICPASTYQELALAGIEASAHYCNSGSKHDFTVLHDMDFQTPLVFCENTCYMIRTSVIFETGNAGSWKVTTSGGEKTHACGTFQLQLLSSIISNFRTICPILLHRIASIISNRDTKIYTTSSIYQVFFPRVVTYGKDYRIVRTLTTSADGTEGYATIQLPSNSDRDCFVVHPILMDAMLHVAGFIANIGGSANDAFICSKVGCVEAIPRLIDNSAPYGVYVNCAWLPGGDMLAESYTIKHDLDNQIVAHLEGIYFRKVPLTTLEHGLTLAAGAILPGPSKFQGIRQSPAASFVPLPYSKQLIEVAPGDLLPKSRVLMASVSSPDDAGTPSDSLYGADSVSLSLTLHDIDVATVGTDLSTPCVKPEVGLQQDALVEQLSDPGDKISPSDVKAILAAVLGLEMMELCEEADLELLGLDSLASIEAHVKAIQSFITSHLIANDSSLNGSMCLYSVDRAPPTATRLEPADRLNTVTVSVQRTLQSGKVPLFLIHDGSGLVKYVHSLPPLGRDLWGIHNPNFIKSRPWVSVESMAIEYAKYTIKAVGLGPVILGGWSLGGIIAFEVARHLLKLDVPVKGVVLIDSPSPLNHVPLSDALIDSIMKPNHNSVSSNVGPLVKRQFQMNSQMLLHYDPTVRGEPYPQLALLCSCENYTPCNTLEDPVPGWLSNKGRRRSAAADWETIVDYVYGLCNN